MYSAVLTPDVVRSNFLMPDLIEHSDDKVRRRWLTDQARRLFVDLICISKSYIARASMSEVMILADPWFSDLNEDDREAILVILRS